MVEGLSWALSDFTCAEVIVAIGEYIKTNADIPTPSDIRKIINPPKKQFQPDWAFYASLKQILKDKGDYALSSDEIDYIHACEKHSIQMMKESA